MTPLITSMSRLVPDPECGYWFDLGELPDGKYFDLDPELMIHLPYDAIFMVGTYFSRRFLIKATFSNDSVGMTGFLFADELREIKPFAYILKDDKLAVWPQGATSNTDTMFALGVLDTLLRRLDVAQTAHQPVVAETFTNRRKIAQGKRPTYDWRTITVQPRVKSEPQGGTHASPRAHDRRGHWRTLKEKKVWVRPCRVGNPADGQVFHDYKVPEPIFLS